MPDLAAICLVAGVLLVIVMLFVHFILWLRVRYDVKTSLQLWEQRLAAVEITTKDHQLPQLVSRVHKAELQVANLDESLKNFMKKGDARIREEEKRQAKAEKADDQADDDDKKPEASEEALAAALAAQQQMFGQAGQQPAGPRRLKIKRFGT